MFRITCMIDDKHLANALRLLATSNAYDVQSVPVVNATKKNGAVLASGGGNADEMFHAYLKKHKLKTFDGQIAKGFLASHGFAVSTVAYLIKKMIENKYAKLKARGVWEVKS